MILKIAKLPSQVLRAKNPDVTFPLSKDTKKLILNMLDTVKKVDGIGLAAPQVSVNLNMAIIYLEHAGIPPFVIINPKIIKQSKEQVVIEEGCLSLPQLFGEVSRPKKITVEFQDLEGNTQTLTDDGWIARVIQHENDHLNGTLIIDKFKKITQGENLVKNFIEK